ncbi:MAG TPA: glycine cleavage T C-terminal barrel domain-containing protein [Tepidisphaeraceae bacterium]|jgi:folate-binding protein YgfZ
MPDLNPPPVNPLIELHRQAEAETQPYGEIEIVSTFGEPQAEYAAIRKGAALMDLPQRGILEMTGKDRLPFLNNLITNQVWDKQAKQGIEAGKGVYAFLLDARAGRIQADMNVLERGESTWLEMDARLIEPTRLALEKYRFAEQVKIRSRVGELHQIGIHGPGAQAILGESIVGLEPTRCASAKLLDIEVTVWRDDPAGVPGYYLIAGAADAQGLWENLIEKWGQPTDLGKRTLRRIGWAAYNAARIEGGRALFGVDFDNSILPAETGELLNRAVSFTKGCYPGQEIVARMHARQQVAKKLVGIRMDGDALPIAGTKILDDKDNEIGGITSSTVSPVLSNVAICLGFLKRPHFNLGTKVRIPAEGSMREGTVVELPFLKNL